MDATSIPDIPELVGAIGALGLAAFALVDCSKIGRHGGVSHSGFQVIESAIQIFYSDANLPSVADINKALPFEKALLQTLHAHWINGVAIADQKAIAKSLVKLKLTPENAEYLARVAAVDPATLKEVAARMITGDPLEDKHTNALGRFDLAVTAILDAAYQRADQRYRNAAKLWASFAAVTLAIVGGLIVDAQASHPFSWSHLFLYSLCGILAVPLAPISKDLASALSAAVKVAQTVRR